MPNTEAEALITQAMELADKATPGPWRHERVDHDDGEISHEIFTYPRSPSLTAGLFLSMRTSLSERPKENATFIAASRTLVPDLATALRAALDRAEAAETRARELEAALAKVDHVHAWNWFGAEFGFPVDYLQICTAAIERHRARRGETK